MTRRQSLSKLFAVQNNTENMTLNGVCTVKDAEAKRSLPNSVGKRGSARLEECENNQASAAKHGGVARLEGEHFEHPDQALAAQSGCCTIL